ncbi:hypothetical protein R1sor_015479 [Riccia sorocarpa]|uniref:Bifunctional inhibitor/plant lipid transfer protein/seed storage helical domain-containing protein n=1 Tax=Riccia sorocarpa TaxID=122646 RepID=A0ABD3HFP3_9MARC
MATNRVAAISIFFMGIVVMAQLSEGKNCPNNLLLSLAPCASAVSGNRPSVPSGACCTAVRKADVDCVCQAYTRGQIPKSVNKNLVLGLVKKCKKSIPKNYKCGGTKPLANQTLKDLRSFKRRVHGGERWNGRRAC